MLSRLGFRENRLSNSPTLLKDVSEFLLVLYFIANWREI